MRTRKSRIALNISKLPLIGLISDVAPKDVRIIPQSISPSPSKSILLSNFDLSGLNSHSLIVGKLGMLTVDRSMNQRKNFER